MICCSRSYRSLSVCCLSGALLIIEVVEVVEHEVHVFLFLLLKMVDDSFVFVNFNANVRISLPWNCSWLDKLVIIHMVVALSSWNFGHHPHRTNSVKRLFLLASDWVVVELSALFLKLILAYVEGVPTDRVDSVCVWVLKLLICWWTRLVHIVEIVVDITWVWVLITAKDWRLERFMAWVSVLLLVHVPIVHVHILGVLADLLLFEISCVHAAHNLFRIWSKLTVVCKIIVTQTWVWSVVLLKLIEIVGLVLHVFLFLLLKWKISIDFLSSETVLALIGFSWYFLVILNHYIFLISNTLIVPLVLLLSSREKTLAICLNGVSHQMHLRFVFL